LEHGGNGEHGSLLQFIYHLGFPHWIPDIVPMSWVVILLLTAISYFATRRMSRVPGKLQNMMELIVSALDGFVKGVVGPQYGPQFTPLIGTFFIYIFMLNILGLIPGFKSPTANLNTTAALGITAFILVQYHAIRIGGLKNYLMHFVGEPIWLAPLNIPVHVIGELARPLSLSLRLYGNIFGEDMVIIILAGLAATALPAFLPIPFQFPMMMFGLFTGFVQALVFSMLTAIYISVAITHEEH
jgi:F-type H+-transporting ATPase subunit a